jgi:hypothetical protein
MNPTRSARVVAVLFLAQAVFVVLHRLTGTDYRVFTHDYNVAGDWSLCFIWTLAAVAALVQGSGVAFFLVCIGAVTSLTHGLMLLVATSPTVPRGLGLPFMVAAVFEVLLTIHAVPAFRHPVPHALRARHA